MSVKTGQVGPHQQPSEYGRTDSGSFSVIAFEDVEPSRIDGLALQCEAQGQVYRVTHGHGKSRIEIQYSYNFGAVEQPIDLWEYSGRSTPKSLLQAATNTGITGFLSQKNVELISKCVGNDFSDTADKQTLVAADFKDGDSARAMIIYNLMKAGFSDYPVRAPILRHTQNVSQIWPVRFSKLNVGKIISTSTLYALETVPDWAIDGLPNIAPPSFTDGKLFAFGWYKDEPTLSQIAGRKISLVQEFQYGLWPTKVFGDPL